MAIMPTDQSLTERHFFHFQGHLPGEYRYGLVLVMDKAAAQATIKSTFSAS